MIQGILWDVSGGQAKSKTSDSSTSQWAYIGLEALAGLVGNDGFFNWLSSNMSGKMTPATWDIYSLVRGDTQTWTATDLIPRVITFPACDVDSKDPGGITVLMDANLKLKDGGSSPKNQDVARKQKMWMCSQFRLRIGDLPCNRVQRIGVHSSVRQTTDQTLRYVPGPLTFDIPAADAPAFQKAFEATLAGVPTEYPVQVDYLDADGNRLLSFVTSMIIVACGPSNIWGDPFNVNATIQVTASIQDEGKGFSNIIR